MATNRGLRKSDDQLKSARLSFIESLQAKRQFEDECAVIVPELERLWTEKITVPFNLPVQEYIEVGTVVNGEALRETQEGVNVINWRHYLYNYDPFMLKKAITRLASRLELDTDGVFGTAKVKNTRGVVENIPAYFKALVQDARIKELKKAAQQ